MRTAPDYTKLCHGMVWHEGKHGRHRPCIRLPEIVKQKLQQTRGMHGVQRQEQQSSPAARAAATVDGLNPVCIERCSMASGVSGTALEQYIKDGTRQDSTQK